MKTNKSMGTYDKSYYTCDPIFNKPDFNEIYTNLENKIKERDNTDEKFYVEYQMNENIKNLERQIEIEEQELENNSIYENACNNYVDKVLEAIQKRHEYMRFIKSTTSTVLKIQNSQVETPPVVDSEFLEKVMCQENFSKILHLEMENQFLGDKKLRDRHIPTEYFASLSKSNFSRFGTGIKNKEMSKSRNLTDKKQLNFNSDIKSKNEKPNYQPKIYNTKKQRNFFSQRSPVSSGRKSPTDKTPTYKKLNLHHVHSEKELSSRENNTTYRSIKDKYLDSDRKSLSKSNQSKSVPKLTVSNIEEPSPEPKKIKVEKLPEQVNLNVKVTKPANNLHKNTPSDHDMSQYANRNLHDLGSRSIVQDQEKVINIPVQEAFLALPPSHNIRSKNLSRDNKNETGRTSFLTVQTGKEGQMKNESQNKGTPKSYRSNQNDGSEFDTLSESEFAGGDNMQGDSNRENNTSNGQNQNSESFYIIDKNSEDSENSKKHFNPFTNNRPNNLEKKPEKVADKMGFSSKPKGEKPGIKEENSKDDIRDFRREESMNLEKQAPIDQRFISSPDNNIPKMTNIMGQALATSNKIIKKIPHSSQSKLEEKTAEKTLKKDKSSRSSNTNTEKINRTDSLGKKNPLRKQPIVGAKKKISEFRPEDKNADLPVLLKIND